MAATTLYGARVYVPVTTTAPSSQLEPRIRQAERADLLAVYRIEQDVFPQPWPFNAFEQYLGEPGFLVAESGAILGYVVADITPTHARPLGHIKDLAVHEACQGQGIGSSLLESAIAILEGDIDRVKLEVRESNDGAISLYESHGFEYHRTIEGYYSNGESALVLFKKL